MVAKFLIAMGALAVVTACAPTYGQVSVINRSSEAVARLRVDVASEEFEAHDVRPGDHVTFTFEPFGDSSYEVDIELESGKHISQRLGYVTDGHPSRDEIYILDERLELVPGFARDPNAWQPSGDSRVVDAAAHSGGTSW